MPLSLPIGADANALLERSRRALLIGMALDQHVGERMSSAWTVDSSNGLTSGI